MPWEIQYHPAAIKELHSLELLGQKRIIAAIGNKLSRDPIHFGKPLTGELAHCYRLRVENYRVLYQVRKKTATVLILKIGDRKSVYARTCNRRFDLL